MKDFCKQNIYFYFMKLTDKLGVNLFSKRISESGGLISGRLLGGFFFFALELSERGQKINQNLFSVDNLR